MAIEPHLMWFQGETISWLKFYSQFPQLPPQPPGEVGRSGYWVQYRALGASRWLNMWRCWCFRENSILTPCWNCFFDLLSIVFVIMGCICACHVWLFLIPQTAGSSIHGIFQARKLEWVAIFYSRVLFQLRDRTSCLLCLQQADSNTEPPRKPFYYYNHK